VIDRLVRDHQAASRSELVTVALEAYLFGERSKD
jgi:metal-responsive CopG/Arc/MetJ family transcriptional regulator